MTTVTCDKCGVEVKEYYLPIFDGDGNFWYGLCEDCDTLLDEWMTTEPPCEDATPDPLPLTEMAKRLLNNTGYSLTAKTHCCKSCDTDKMYETEEVSRYDLIQLQHAYIDWKAGHIDTED